MANGAGKTETIEGTVDRVVFHNPANGYTVVRLHAENAALLQTVVGRFQQLSAGEKVRLTGQWKLDPKHGRQFAAETCVPLAPATVTGIEKYLGSGLVPGLGPVMAKRIVEKFGIDTLEVLKRDPAKLSQVEGIGPKRATAIREALVAKEAVQEVMVFLESAGISPAFAHRIFRRYGNDAIRVVSENPYQLASDVSGIGFLSADKIAAHLGIPKDAHPRAEAGLLYVLDELAKEGHVFAEKDHLFEAAQNLLDVDHALLVNAQERLVLMGKIRVENGTDCYLSRLYRAEQTVADILARFLDRTPRTLDFNEAEAVRNAEARSGIQFAKAQRDAFSKIKRTGLMLLTGGPGTGKTTLLKGIVDCLARQRLRVVMAAPTGRAAKRMSEAAARDARTIHRLLEFTPKTMRFERNQEQPLEADVVVIDEVSMVDIELFAALLSALPTDCRLILVGDPDQLPSVGPGTVLADMLRLSERHPRLAAVRLTEIFRQAQSSLIVTGAHQILRGEAPTTGEKGQAADLFLVERNSPEACLDTIKALVSERIPKRFHLDPLDDIQVLTPMHKGLLGAATLNEELQDLLNPVGQGPTVRNRFRLGDKVMQVRNNYDLEVFNGDIGRVSTIDPSLEWVEVDFGDRTVRYPASELEQLTLAYACSIHKSQGSEYKAVVIPLHTQHFVMLKRNLLYTAITRGKQLVVVVGSKRALGIAVRNADELTRNTGLVARVEKAYDKSI